jgi:hypothetical protein
MAKPYQARPRLKRCAARARPALARKASAPAQKPRQRALDDSSVRKRMGESSAPRGDDGRRCTPLVHVWRTLAFHREADCLAMEDQRRRVGDGIAFRAFTQEILSTVHDG